MPTHFQIVLEQRRDLLRRKAIWQEVVDHLQLFLDTDSIKAKHGIKCETEDMVVPQAVISDVVAEIEANQLDEIMEDLDKIDRSEVSDVEQEEQEADKQVEVGGEAEE